MIDKRIHEPDKSCRMRHQDIARFARTCKAFKDPALDFLWRTQPSLSPLIMCLPGHSWTVKRAKFDPVVNLHMRTGSACRDIHAESEPLIVVRKIHP
ncbi:hypothetical protein EDD17DRAFT_1666438 [Pisolithus thermaeus]|nr:hypothetical protein EDD17DRAFT_1666438 [Pisolithus thermaeus]